MTTNAGSIAELAAHELTALVVPARDPGALRDAIDKLAANPDFRKNLGAAARRHCSQHLSYETMLDRMEAIYRQVSGRPARQ